MSELNISSLNCRGLGSYQKRRDVFHYLRKSPFHINLLQDIHCERGKENTFRNAWGTDILIAPYIGAMHEGLQYLQRELQLGFVRLGWMKVEIIYWLQLL